MPTSRHDAKPVTSTSPSASPTAEIAPERSGNGVENEAARLPSTSTIVDGVPRTTMPRSSQLEGYSKTTKWRRREDRYSHTDGRASASDTPAMRRQGGGSSGNDHVSKLNATLHQVVKVITRNNHIPTSKDGRHIILDTSSKDHLTDERTGKEYISNRITSSRYTSWSFLPRQLAFQFSRLSNFYFLCVSVLQLTGFSTTGTYGTIVPLVAFVSIAMAKEGYDDYRRHALDRVENRSRVKVLRAEAGSGKQPVEEIAFYNSAGEAMCWVDVKWSDVKVGNIVKLARNDAIPADLVLLYSNGPNGMAYIDTAALDGESNLKARQASPIWRKVCQNENDLAYCKASIVAEDPNIDLYNFDGRITVGNETLPLTGNEVIYRGSVLRNTPQALGIIINTGEECKIRMNATKNPRAKAPSIQKIVNQIVIIIAIFVMVLTGLNNAAYGVYQNKEEKRSWYLQEASVGHWELFASSFVMFSTLIPLSLYVGLEFVKACQMYILGDIDMYDAESDTPMEARTNTINEELGQVSHVFSDKTGTLTKNIMRFRKMSVAGISWLHDFDLKRDIVEQEDEQKSHAVVREEELPTAGELKRASDGRGSWSSIPCAPETTESNAVPRSTSEPTTRDLHLYLHRNRASQFAEKTKFFLLAMALCHTALPEVKEDGEIDYQAMSPDELALVRAAKDLGVTLQDGPSQTMTISTRNGAKSPTDIRETYEVLDVIEFSSERKRMSIIIRFPDGRICLFCKGADSTIIKRLRTANEAVEKEAVIQKSLAQQRLSEAQEVLGQESESQPPRSSLTRTSFGRKSTGDRRSTIDGLGLTTMNSESESPRISMAAPKKSLSYDRRRNSMIDTSVASDDSAVLESTLRHISDFATEGLRTLMYGYRFLGESEYRTWRKEFHKASISLVDRQKLIDQASNTLEQNLELAGATAIEDELQKGVPETIDKLRRAGMKLWMLTGDKRETAINVGHSCKIIKDYSEVRILDHKENVEQVIARALLDIQQGGIAHSVIVVDGQTLGNVETNPSLASTFFELAILADSVICCRASPTQKAFLVNMIKKKVKGSVTLAIGDSANDIAMIQEANVGIGISGKEGMQAARTSDYSIGQFRFLQKLILVHGRWNYIRTCKYILGTFWTQMMFFLTQAVYQGYNGFTGTSLYEYWSNTLFSLVFAVACIVILGCFEQDLEANTLLAVPELYRQGPRNEGFNLKNYAWWNFMALTDAVLIYYFIHLAYGIALFTDVVEDSSDLFAFGQLAFTVSVILINMKLLGIEMYNKTLTSAVSWLYGVGGWWLWNVVISEVYDPSTSYYGVKDGFLHRFGRSSLWWLVVILTSTAVLAWEVVVVAIRIAYFPSDADVFRELESDPMWKQRFKEIATGENPNQSLRRDEETD